MNVLKITPKTDLQKDRAVKSAIRDFTSNKEVIIKDFSDGKHYNGIYTLQDQLKKDDNEAHNRNMSHIRSFVSKMQLSNEISRKAFKITSEKPPLLATKESLVSSLYSNPKKHERMYKDGISDFSKKYKKMHSRKDMQEIPVLDEDFC